MEDNIISLDELAGTTSGNSHSFDMTSGTIKVENTDMTPRKVVPVMGRPMDTDSVKPVNIDTLLPKREKPEVILGNDLFDDLDKAVDREKENITKRHEELFEVMKKEVEAEQDTIETQELDNSIENGESTIPDLIMPDTNSKHDHTFTDWTEGSNTVADNNNEDDIVVRTSSSENILGYINNDELFDDESDENTKDDTIETPSDEELFSSIKEQVKQRISDSSRKGIDLTKFTFAKKALSAQKVMKLAVTGHQNVADWVLPVANKTISMTGLSGPEILKLDANNSNRNRMNTFRDMYGVLYKHVIDANKPEFEVWLKNMRFIDLQHIYFAAYMATFSGSSFTNYSCPHCSNVFIHDIDFKDLVKYKDDNAKARIHELMKRDSTSVNPDTYEAELVQISEKYAFAIRTPSIWNTVIEIATLSDKFLETHADLIDLITYIEGIYLIDYESTELVPVDTKPDPDDMGKTVARRVKSMYDIISTLSSDEYTALRSAIASIDENVDEITYKLPGCTCPKCSKEIPENNNITPEQLLFTRHRLAAIANMSN